MKIIVAVNKLGYIGLNGQIPWKSKADFKHFKAMTMGGILIVGQTTFEHDLQCRQLPGRKMIVVGDKEKGYFSLWGAVQEALEYRRIGDSMDNIGFPETPIWVIGGQSIYEQLMPLVEEIHLSFINDETVGDRKFEVPEKFRGKLFTYTFEPDAPKTT